MFCRECGKEIENDSKFCKECGFRCASIRSETKQPNTPIWSLEQSNKRIVEYRKMVGAVIAYIFATFVLIVAIAMKTDCIANRRGSDVCRIDCKSCDDIIYALLTFIALSIIGTLFIWSRLIRKLRKA